VSLKDPFDISVDHDVTIRPYRINFNVSPCIFQFNNR